MPTLKPNAFDQYYKEPGLLGSQGLHAILERGKQWDLSKTLSSGGSAIFPHTYLAECGHQIAAVVHGCLDSGADQVLVLGVLHSLIDELKDAKLKEKNQEDISGSACKGIFGPGIQEHFLEKEFSLFFFTRLWNEEVKRRGIKSPKLILRYPFLVNSRPDLLPGIQELEELARDSVVVATADFVHYGVAYQSLEPKPMDNHSLHFAKTTIAKGFDILASGNYQAYSAHCYEAQSDSMYSCSVLRHLLGPLTPELLDIKLVDSSRLFEGDPSPSWVAATLVELKP